MYATHLDLPEIARPDTIALLQARLDDAFDLAARIKQGYWNMRHSSSFERRELFEACHDEIDEVHRLAGQTDRGLVGRCGKQRSRQGAQEFGWSIPAADRPRRAV